MTFLLLDSESIGLLVIIIKVYYDNGYLLLTNTILRTKINDFLYINIKSVWLSYSPKMYSDFL